MLELQLGDDIQRLIDTQVKPNEEACTSKTLKFDAKGSLHCMYRDEDGALLHDERLYMEESDKEKAKASTENRNMILELRELQASNERSKNTQRKGVFLVGIIFALLYLFVGFIRGL